MGVRKWLGWEQSEREKWQAPLPLVRPEFHLGGPALDPRSRDLYENRLPRGVQMPRQVPERPPVNHWMRPADLLNYRYRPGQIILGKFANTLLGYLDDRPAVTAAGARAGKSSTVLEPNLYLYPGSMVVLDPKGELAAKTACVRWASGHDVHVLDPFSQSGQGSSSFNILAELDPSSDTIIDDVASITQAIIVDDGESRSKHWNDSARQLLMELILLTLTFARSERHLVTVRQLLSLSHPLLVAAVAASADERKKRKKKEKSESEPTLDDDFFIENRSAVETLLRTMAAQGERYEGILAAIGKRFATTPSTERGSIFSTAAAQTDFLDSIPLRRISQKSDFSLANLRGDRPMTIYLCLPAGRMQSHFRWLRLIVQQACTTLEKLGAYPRSRPPILFMMEEFATLGHMEIMERAAAYFPGFGVKLWAVLQDMTQLRRYYESGWETFLGNAGLVQCFANGDQTTLEFITRRLENMIQPFELRTAMSRTSFGQLLMFEGEPPAAAVRLEHADVQYIRESVLRRRYDPRLLK